MRHTLLYTLASALIALAALPTPAAAQTQQTTGSDGRHNFEVAKNLDIFNSAYRDLDLYYVDTLDASKRVIDALDYMLETLDPYTEYFDADHTDDLKQLTTGKYTGIGSIISYKEKLKRCVIATPFEGMPAAMAGLRPGDIIMAIDGQPIAPCSKADAKSRADYSSSISERLRGEPGTTLVLTVKRPGSEKTYTYNVIRRNVVRPSVTLATVVGDNTGYIRLSNYIEGTSNEVRRALTDLKQRGARSLILDLRDNPGGLLEEAVKTVNLFIPRSREVVSTRGKVKELDQTYKTTLDALDTDIPLIVLTNEGTASAAEITSGALQDYDRALIMGRRTYGKGLVQQSRELPYKGLLKLTVGKYYIPSGRCVQAYSFKDGMPVHLPDSLTKEFRTAAGRIVRDGGGITPDVVLKADSLPSLIAYLAASDQLFDYCVNYRATHDEVAKPEQFSLSDADYADFCAYMKRNKFTYDRQSLRVLQTLRRIAKLEGYDTEAAAELDTLEQKLQHNEDHDFHRWQKEIRQTVEAMLMEHYYYESGRLRYELRSDPDVKEAVKMIRQPALMHKNLSGEPDA